MDTVLLLTISTLAPKFTKSGQNALLVAAYRLGTMYVYCFVCGVLVFFLVLMNAKTSTQIRILCLQRNGI